MSVKHQYFPIENGRGTLVCRTNNIGYGDAEVERFNYCPSCACKLEHDLEIFRESNHE